MVAYACVGLAYRWLAAVSCSPLAPPPLLNLANPAALMYASITRPNPARTLLLLLEMCGGWQPVESAADDIVRCLVCYSACASWSVDIWIFTERSFLPASGVIDITNSIVLGSDDTQPLNSAFIDIILLFWTDRETSESQHIHIPILKTKTHIFILFLDWTGWTKL